MIKKGIALTRNQKFRTPKTQGLYLYCVLYAWLLLKLSSCFEKHKMFFFLIYVKPVSALEPHTHTSTDLSHVKTRSVGEPAQHCTTPPSALSKTCFPTRGGSSAENMSAPLPPQFLCTLRNKHRLYISTCMIVYLSVYEIMINFLLWINYV